MGLCLIPERRERLLNKRRGAQPLNPPGATGLPAFDDERRRGVARVLFVAFVTGVISMLMFVLYRLRQ